MTGMQKGLGKCRQAGAAFSHNSDHPSPEYTHQRHPVFVLHPYGAVTRTTSQLQTDNSFMLLLDSVKSGSVPVSIFTALLMTRFMSMGPRYTAIPNPSDIVLRGPPIARKQRGGEGGVRNMLLPHKGTQFPAFLPVVFYFCLPHTKQFAPR